MQVRSRPRRSFVKGVSWETFSFFLTLFIIWAITRDFRFTLELSIICTGAKVFFFYLHERIWQKVKWGKEQVGTGELDQLRAALYTYRVALLLDKSLTLETLGSVLKHFDKIINKET